MDRTLPGRRRRPSVVERKLDQLDACLAEALTSRPRRSDVDGSLHAEIHARTDFLRSLIAAEREGYGGAYLVEDEERFGVLERTFQQWAQSGVAAATQPFFPAGRDEIPDQGSGSGSGGCACTDSCFGFEVTGQEAALDAQWDPEREAAEVRKVPAAAAARSTARRRWWKRRAALCVLAGVVAVAVLGAGLALQFAAVAQQSAHLVPT